MIITRQIASSQPCSHSHKSDHAEDHTEELNKEFLDVASFLEAQFGEVELDEKEKKITVKMDDNVAVVDTLKFVSY